MRTPVVVTFDTTAYDCAWINPNSDWSESFDISVGDVVVHIKTVKDKFGAAWAICIWKSRVVTIDPIEVRLWTKGVHAE